MRSTKKQIFGIPIPNRPLSREELQDFREKDFRGLGLETRFWPWYFRTCWFFAKAMALVVLLGAVLGYGVSFLNGTTYDFLSTAYKLLRLMALALFAPAIFLAVAYSWWYGSIAIDRLRRRNRQK